MKPVILYPYNLQVEHVGVSTDTKPDKANKYAIYLEQDTQKIFYWNDADWVEIVTPDIKVTLDSEEIVVSNMIPAVETGLAKDSSLANIANIPPLGQALAGASVPVVLPAAQVTTLTPPAAITGYATETTLGTVHGHLDSIDTKMVSGTDIGDVTINNLGGGAAVNIQDGGNTITVDGSVGVSSLPAIPHDPLSASDVVTVTGGAGQSSDVKITLDGEGVTASVTGTVTASQGTPPWTMDVTKVAGESIQVAGGTEEKSIRVTIASDSTGLLSVDDNGSSLTVDAESLPLPDNAAQEEEGNLEKIEKFHALQHSDLLRQILTELRVITFIMSVGFRGNAIDVCSIDGNKLREELS